MRGGGGWGCRERGVVEAVLVGWGLDRGGRGALEALARAGVGVTLIVTTNAAGAELDALRSLATEAGAGVVAVRADQVRELPAGTHVAACDCAPEVSAELRAQAGARQTTLETVYHLRRRVELERARASL